MAANIEQMFYVRSDGLPWHGEGIPVDDAQTWNDAVRIGGLDWDVIPKTVVFESVTRPGSFHEYPARKVLVRESTGAPLSVVSDDYKVIQNRDLFDFIDPLIASGEAVFRTAGVIGNGERVWALAKLTDTIDAREGDPLEFYFLLTAAHDGKRSADIALTTVRTVCENTLEAGLAGAARRFTVRHAGDVKAKMKQATQLMGITRASIAEVTKQVYALVSAKATPEKVESFLLGVFPTPTPKKDERPDAYGARLGKTIALRRRANELASVGAGNGFGSLYDLVNGVTDFVDHELVTRTRNSRLLYTSEGPGALIKRAAWSEALALAA